MNLEKILIVDYGSQYSRLIARRIRELNVYTEIVSFDSSLDKFKGEKVKGIILSGGPNSIYEENSPKINKEIYALNKPILGICYGMQLTQYMFGGEIKSANTSEYGKAIVKINDDKIFEGIPKESIFWMSHGDSVTKYGEGFKEIATSEKCVAGLKHETKDIYTFQFHPEVTHSEYGGKLLENFTNICKIKKEWKLDDYIETTIKNIQETVKNEKVILGLSGGVDSSVAAMLIHKAIGKSLTCIFVDTGLLRKDEGDKVIELYSNNFNLNVVRVNKSSLFLEALKGISEPETKRKIIGKLFIQVFDEEKEKQNQAKFLAQGTIYPDIIESSTSGVSQTIKSHHNVGGLPENMSFEILEPLKWLFKDEVREIGLRLGIPRDMIFRHPFPGPGLGIRVIEEVTQEKVKILQEADEIFINELIKNNLYDDISQAFVTLLPCKTVGVMGDCRTYEYVCAIRCVNTIDFMTATFSKLPYDFLEDISTKIINEVQGINRVVYDITNKAPGTIEWE
ncbi:MAG: glutamine-hydrolyzing GMP synthase [Lachnospirales bacterium]